MVLSIYMQGMICYSTEVISDAEIKSQKVFLRFLLNILRPF